MASFCKRRWYRVILGLKFITHTLRLLVMIYRVQALYADYIFLKYVLKRSIPYEKKMRIHLKAVKIYVKTAAKIKGGLIKVGQLLSSRADILPSEIIAILATLQDQAKPTPWYIVEECLRRELGEEKLADFSEIFPKAVAAASLGQVHKALHNNGSTIILKIQHPGIKYTMKLDMYLLTRLARRVDRALPEMHILPLFNELVKETWRELDYCQEAINCQRIGENFRNNPKILIPRVYSQYCTGKILALSMIHGLKITDLEKIKSYRLDINQLMTNLVECYARQFFLDGFFQADPHPGNLFVTTDGQVALIDFGMCKVLTPQLKKAIRKATFAVLSRDAEQLGEALASMGCMDTADIPKLVPYIHRIGRRVKDGKASEITAMRHHISDHATSMVNEFRQMVRELHLILPEDMLLFGRALSLLEGVACQVTPELEIFKIILPIMMKMFASVEPITITDEIVSVQPVRKPRKSRR